MTKNLPELGGDTFLNPAHVPLLIREENMPVDSVGFAIVQAQSGPNLSIILENEVADELLYTGPEASKVSFPRGTKLFFNQQGKLVSMSLADGRF